jgi:hypothetical protein
MSSDMNDILISTFSVNFLCLPSNRQIPDLCFLIFSVICTLLLNVHNFRKICSLWLLKMYNGNAITEWNKWSLNVLLSSQVITPCSHPRQNFRINQFSCPSINFMTLIIGISYKTRISKVLKYTFQNSCINGSKPETSPNGHKLLICHVRVQLNFVVITLISDLSTH